MTPRNLLFFLSDQHNRDTLGCYGHPMIRTPNLDALAARGTRFTSAYCNCPICVPSRASLATGRYVHEIGYWDNAFPYEGRVKGWGHRLIEEGHEVVAIGKLHYRSAEDEDGFSEKILPLNVVDGVGDVMGSIRDDLPNRQGTRDGILGAGPGNSTYLDYDAQIAQQACNWLRGKSKVSDRTGTKPWVLLVSFVCPHPPFIAPQELYESYPLEEFSFPVQNRPEEQPMHPALVDLRRAMQYEEPFTLEQIRNVTAAYYGTCTYLDQQIGKVLSVLEQTGQTATTRIIYTSDHGESMGRRGLFGKFTLYEEAAAVPFFLVGPDVPAGEVVDDPISLIDCYQTILEAVGVGPASQDVDLPGSSLWPIARRERLERTVLSEYHAVASTSASYMIRSGKYKYIHYVGYPAQLFDLDQDPQETNDLAVDPNHQSVLADCEAKLRQLLDPEAVDRRAKADQQALLDRHGGREEVLRKGTFINSPVPGEKPSRVSGIRNISMRK